MKREEFEATLKRALELQGLQNSEGDDSLSEEDLTNAAQRLKIPPEVLQKALLDVRRSRKQFRVKGTPDEVREGFLKTFLLQNAGFPHRLPPLRIDRQALQVGKATTIRVQDSQFLEVDAELSFTADGADHTLVSWSGNTSLSLRTNIFLSLIPIIVCLLMAGPMLVAGAPLAAFLPAILIPLFILWIMHWSSRRNAHRVNRTLTEYFENIQILGDLKEQRSAEQELQELRAWKEKTASQPSSATSSTPSAQTHDSNAEPESPPPSPQTQRLPQ